VAKRVWKRKRWRRRRKRRKRKKTIVEVEVEDRMIDTQIEGTTLQVVLYTPG
jgi:hypothetical protein